MLSLTVFLVILKSNDICNRIKEYYPDLIQVDPLTPDTTFHLSLSRTLYVKDHQKDLFKQKIINALKSIDLPTKLKCEKMEIYLNDAMTRTFLAVDVENDEKILNAIYTIDKILKDFGLPVYYKEPKLHFSLFWCPGNRKEEENFKDIQNLNFDFEEVKIKGIFIKCGNKVIRI